MKTYTSFNMKAIIRLASVLLLMIVGIGQMWGTVPTTAKLSFGEPGVSADFESASVASIPNNTGSSVSSTTLSGYGPFSAYYLGKNDNGNQSIAIVDGSADNDDPMTSKYFAMTSTTNGTCVSFARTAPASFSTQGAFSFKIAKTSKLTIGLYNGSASGTFAHSNAAACLNFDGGSNIKISAGTNASVNPTKWDQIVSSSLPSDDVLAITVVYNTTNTATTYGGSIALAAYSAHVYINGTAADDGAGNAKNFSIRGNTITHFWLFNNSGSKNTTNTAKVDDIIIYDALPTVAGDAITLDKNNSDASGSTSGSGTIAANATSLTSGFTPPTRTGYSVEGYYTTSECATKIATSAGALQANITVDAVNWTNGSSQWKKGGAATFFTKWTPKTYTVTLNDNSGSGGSGSKTVTFNANTNMTSAVAIPEKTHYIFGGYWTSANSGATLDTKVIDSDGTWVASVSGYTDATPNWIKADDVTLYAKWTEHTYTNYRTSCCTELGTIDGEASLTQAGNSVTISGWSDVSNVGTYTVKMYKKNGASWDLVSGSAANGDAGTAGTRTGISSSSKSVTYTGLEVESEYKFTVQAIAGSAAYCDGVETAITTINGTDVSSTPFKFRYSIYIDNGSGSGWAHHYITPTGNTDEGSVAIDLSAHVTSYQFKIFGGFSGNWGQSTNDGVIPANTKWTLNGSFNVKLNSGAGGSYTFTVDYSSTDPAVTVTFPSADQASGYKIYFDKSVIDGWGNTLKYRIGNNSHNQNQNFSPVTGTDNFYVTTTPNYGSMDAWQIANNVAWVPGNDGEYNAEHGIYNYYHNGDANNITKATVYFDYAVDEDITIVPTTKKNTENSCDFWYVDKTSGMLTHNVSLNSPAHGTLLATYTNTSGTTGQTVTEGNNADLAHRCILTITATPDDGYTCTSLTVDGNAHTSGNTYILDDDATIAATFTANTTTAYTVKHYKQKLDGTYNASPDETDNLTGTTDASVTPERKSYEGFEAPAGQTVTILGDGSRIVEYQYTRNSYDLTWVLNGGKVTTAGTHAAVDATGSPSGSVLYEAAITAPIVEKTGYNMTWSSTPASTMPAANTTYTANWSANNYIIALDNEGADSGKEGTESISVTYDAYTNLNGTPAITKPVKDGYLFGGYFVGDDGTGTQIIDGDGNVIASVASYTSGTKQWIYANNITLHAKWTQVYTVTWSVNGDTWESGVVEGNTHVPGGSKVSALPTAPTSSDCDDSKVFVGWRATAIAGTSASNPSGIFTNVAGSPAIDANKTFYAVFADVSGGDVIEFKLPFDNKDKCGVNNYTSSWVAEVGDYSWTISNFNNNNFSTGWTSDIRCGRNGNASIASITTDAAISFRVDSVYINLTATNDSYINSAKLQISSSSGISTPDEINIPVNTTGVKGLKITSPAKDKYYRVIFDCKSNTNGFVRIGSIVYKQKLDTANYVTSCSSCDADATFTNTTPAVSDIDCTSATLTMEDGLATVGADGCHVSDYGFVIGTSDNPVIGGSGVTKLQVGTSDPTIGEDFSYDATGLTKGTHYYIRAYAINRHGTAYSSSTNFWTNNVSSIAITTAPTKTNYIVGETFDATGMVVTATMASGATEDVTSDVTYSSSALTAGTSQNFAINYTLCETEKSVNQVINVYTLTVTEGTNPSYGTATNSSANIVSITGLGDHKTYTVTVTSSNATAVDNGDNTWRIINPTGNVTVTVDYAEAAQVQVYYKVDGVTVTDLTQNVYQSETTTLPTASELATAMTAQGMEMPDDTYPNFIGWSETEFPAQTAEPSLVTGTPTINAEKTYYAVYTNMGQIHLDAYNLVTTYPSSERTVNVGSKDFKYHYLGDANLSGTHVMQFKKHASEYGYIYNNDALSNILRIEIGYYNSDSHVPVYAASAAGTVTGAALTPASRESTDPYVYTFPASTAYFMIKGDNSSTYKISYIDIYYASSTVYYMTQFCTRYGITGASTSGTDVIVDSYTAGRLTSNYNSACEGKSIQLEAHVNSGYQFGTWTIKKTDDPTQDVTSTLLPGDNASSLTPDAFTMPAYAITVSATITEKEVTGWTWKQELADASEIDIPATVQLYVGQQAWFNLKTYEPADVLNKKKGYYDNYTNTDLAQDGKGNVTYKTRAKIVKESTTLTFTSTNEEVQEVINIQIKALPLVHFVDLIHGELFADVVANVDASEKRTVYTTKPTPTHAVDVSDPGASYNTCERQHLHLIGWIESTWAEEHPNAEPEDITGAGAGNYYAAGADIDLVAQDGKTYYAVWTKIE